jgi:hypothetical protein
MLSGYVPLQRPDMLRFTVRITPIFTMLIQFYAPRIEPLYQSYIKVYSDTGFYLTKATISKENDSDYASKMQNYYKHLQKLKAEIIEEAKQYIDLK